MRGFYIGATGQPTQVPQRPATSRTAEVSFVLEGRWRFLSGRWGNAGEVVLHAGDIISIPTGILCGSDNMGTDYGKIMAILGGVSGPLRVNEDASNPGLVLGRNGKLY